MNERRHSPNGQTELGGLSRRRDIRLDLSGGLQATLIPGGKRLAVLDISAGGLSVRSATPFAPTSVHVLSLTAGSVTVIHRARTAHCRRGPQGDWVIGMAFVDRPLPGGSDLDDLLNALMGSMISFS